jgi:4-amino-4-deoxy-L-arabinose transferase-like glycosyltransferase
MGLDQIQVHRLNEFSAKFGVSRGICLVPYHREPVPPEAGLKTDLEKTTIILVLILAVGVFYTATFRRGNNPGGDFAQYILHAKNIVECRPYADTGYIYNQHYPGLGPRSYPPVLPLMLAPVYGTFGLNLTPMKILMVFFFILSLAFVAAFAWRALPFRDTLAVVLIVGMNPFFWNFKDDVVSDIPFLFFFSLFLWLTERRSEAQIKGAGPGLGGGILCGAVMALAFGTRTIGIALPLVLCISELYRSRKINLFTIVACAVFLVLAAVQGVSFPGGGSYLDQFRGLTPGVVFHNAMLYADAMIKFWDNGSAAWGFLRYPVFLAFLVPACLGYLSRLKKPGPAEWFPVVYLPMVLLWPTPQGARFLIPIFPLFLFWAFLGLERLRRSLLRNTAFGIVLIAVASTYAAKYSTLNFGPIPGGMTDAKRMNCLAFIRSRSQKTDVFICDEPRFLALIAGRRATSYFIPESDAAFWNFASDVRANYLVVGPDEPGPILGLVARHGEGLMPVYDRGGFTVYKIL